MQNGLCFINTLLRRRPDAVAYVKGSKNNPALQGAVRFYGTRRGVIVCSGISGLPQTGSVFAYHIHSGTECTGNTADPFADTGGHYNPDAQPHPYHAGDMPPLFSADGSAFSAFLTNRFDVNEIIGKTVIIHSMPDDFTTQPSGNAGEKIACGVIIPR